MSALGFRGLFNPSTEPTLLRSVGSGSASSQIEPTTEPSPQASAVVDWPAEEQLGRQAARRIQRYVSGIGRGPLGGKKRKRVGRKKKIVRTKRSNKKTRKRRVGIRKKKSISSQITALVRKACSGAARKPATKVSRKKKRSRK